MCECVSGMPPVKGTRKSERDKTDASPSCAKYSFYWIPGAVEAAAAFPKLLRNAYIWHHLSKMIRFDKVPRKMLRFPKVVSNLSNNLRIPKGRADLRIIDIY